MASKRIRNLADRADALPDTPLKGQLASLSICFVEIFRRQPRMISRFQTRPIAIDDGEPSRISVLAFYDHMLPDESFELEAEPLRRAFRGRIEIVTLPFDPAIAARKGVVHE
jgi:hypothetical protein